MNIVEEPIERIKPYANNPRKNDEAVDKVARSLKDYGFQQPIVCDKDGVIIVGHTRLKAAKKIGLKTVPVVYADLPEDKANEYRLVDNKTAEFADWDLGLLDIELGELPDIDAEFYDFDITIDDEPQEIEEDEAPEPPEEPISKIGDLFEVGGIGLFVEILRTLMLLIGLWMG